MLRTVTATRYVTPFREGGSLPRLMEADDLGTYVGWLTAPRSTVVRAGPIHLGKTDDPAAELRRLHEHLVR